MNHVNVASNAERIFGLYVPGALLVGYTLFVLFYYSMALYQDALVSRATGRRTGVLPAYVVMMSTSYMMLAVLTLYRTSQKLGQELTDTFWFATTALWLGVLSLHLVTRTERRRYNRD